MKSEQRHKLQQNELADWLAKVITTIKPYQNAILGGVIVLILAGIFMIWRTGESAAQANKAWNQFQEAFSAVDPSALEKVADDNPKSNAALAADLAAADINLAQGSNMLFINKAAAKQELNKAAELYQEVRARAGSPALSAQATFGLARVRESQGKLNEAMELYAKVAADWPDSVFARMSARRLDDLKKNSTKEMYDKFAQFDPQPDFGKLPFGKTDIDKLPEESPIFIPENITEPKTEQNKEENKDQKAEAKSEETKTGESAKADQSKAEQAKAEQAKAAESKTDENPGANAKSASGAP